MDKKTTKDKLKFIINKIVKKNYFNNTCESTKTPKDILQNFVIKTLLRFHEVIYRQ